MGNVTRKKIFFYKAFENTFSYKAVRLNTGRNERKGGKLIRLETPIVQYLYCPRAGSCCLRHTCNDVVVAEVNKSCQDPGENCSPAASGGPEVVHPYFRDTFNCFTKGSPHPTPPQDQLNLLSHQMWFGQLKWLLHIVLFILETLFTDFFFSTPV